MLSVSPEPSVNRLSFLNDIPGNVEVLTRRMDLGRKGGGGYSIRISSDRDDRRSFVGVKFLISGFFG